MYRNLKNLLDQKNISQTRLSELLKVSEKTIYNKLLGRTDWTLQEVIKIKTFLFPEYDLNYLFRLDKSAYEQTG